MSETVATPESLGGDSTAPGRHLRGNLGVASIVFMVVAAAAPLGVIGGVVPLGHRRRATAQASRRPSSSQR